MPTITARPKRARITIIPTSCCCHFFISVLLSSNLSILSSFRGKDYRKSASFFPNNKNFVLGRKALYFPRNSSHGFLSCYLQVGSSKVKDKGLVFQCHYCPANPFNKYGNLSITYRFPSIFWHYDSPSIIFSLLFFQITTQTLPQIPH